MSMGPGQRAAARACVDGLRAMALLLQQHEAGVEALLEEMASSSGAGHDEGKEAIHTLAALAGGLTKILPAGNGVGGGSKQLLIASATAAAAAAAAKGQHGQQGQQQERLEESDLFPNRTQVMRDPHLLTLIVDNFVRPRDAKPAAPSQSSPTQPPQMGLRRTLNTLGLVSKLFLRVTRQERYWKPICEQLLPVCAADDGALIKERGTLGGYFGAVRDFGRCFLESRLFMDDEDWFSDLIMNVEVYDNHDNFLFLSACGPVAITEENPPEHPEEEEEEDEDNGKSKEYRLSMSGTNRKEIVGPAFSAASRDAAERRFTDMADFFMHAHEDGVPAAITIRVTLTDRRTGKMGVLWNTGDGLPLHVDSFYEEDGSEEDGIPQGALTVATKDWAKLHALSPTFLTTARKAGVPNPLEEDDEEDEDPADGPICSSLWASVGFMVNPVPGQDEDVAGADKLWRFAGGDVENYDKFVSFFHILFTSPNVETIGKFCRSLLT